MFSLCNMTKSVLEIIISETVLRAGILFAEYQLNSVKNVQLSSNIMLIIMN